MKLYLDLEKAVQIPNVSQNTPDEEQSTRAARNAYKRDPIGVMGGGATATDPDEPRKWTKAAENDEEEEDEDEKPMEKAISDEGMDILKSLTNSVMSDINKALPNETETRFLKDVYGYSDREIISGCAIIKNRMRHEFNEWILDDLKKSIANLIDK